MTRTGKIFVFIILIISSYVYASEYNKFGFNGEWQPSLDPITIGPNNFKTLQNMRPVPDGIESVQGYSKINSTATGETGIRSGIQLQTDRSINSVIYVSTSGGTVYENRSTVPNTGEFEDQARELISNGGFDSGTTNWTGSGCTLSSDSGGQSGNCLTITMASGNTQSAKQVFSEAVIPGRTYTLTAYVKSGTSGNEAFFIEATSSNKAVSYGQTAETSTASWVQHTLQFTTLDENIEIYLVKNSATAGTMLFDTVSLSIDSAIYQGASGANIGRFSEYPKGTVGYSNEKESKIISSTELEVPGVFVPTKYIIDSEAISFVDGGANDWITSNPAKNYYWHARGFKTGMQIVVTGANATNNGTYTVNQIITNGQRLYVGDGLVNQSASGVTIDAIDILPQDISDFTDAANNKLQTENNTIDISGDTNILRWYIVSTRPVQGVNYYLSSNNSSTSTLTGYVWTGTTFSGVTLYDGTSDYSGVISMYQDGYVAINHGDIVPKPAHIQGLYLYTYLFELSDGECEIYNISIDTGFSDMVDVWDGIYRQPIKFLTHYASQGANEDSPIDYTTYVATDDGLGAHIGGLQTTEAIYMAFEEPVNAINVLMVELNESYRPDSNVSVYYYSGETYVLCENIIDGTKTSDEGESFGTSGTISWKPPDPGDEQPKSEYGVTGYFYKFKFDLNLYGELPWAGSPVTANYVRIDVIEGIPTPQTIKPFKFPSFFKDRALLCGYTEGNEGNRVDYSMPNAPDVWNGEDTSMDGVQSLYFGGNKKLMAGTQLYNRLGSNMFASWLALKETETYLLVGDGPEDFQIFPINMNIGCPAPFTLANATYDIGQGLSKNIAIWLSYSGPVYFDFAVVKRIPGIEKYFDPSNSEYINSTLIERAVAWYDKTNNEYNLCIPVGTTATDNNKWLVYSLEQKHWFEKVPDIYPQAAIPVSDANGFSYIYGGSDSGYIYRLENGDDWDGTAISHVWETGDFFLSEDIFEETKITKFKYIGKRTTEDTDIYVTHFANAEEDDITFTRTDVTFTAPDTIEIVSGASNFYSYGLKQGGGQGIEISGTDSNNTSGTPLVVSSISSSGETLTVESGISTEASGDTVVFTIDYDFKIPCDSGNERLIRYTNFMDHVGVMHRFKFEVDSGGANAVEKDIQPFLWGIKSDKFGEE